MKKETKINDELLENEAVMEENVDEILDEIFIEEREAEQKVIDDLTAERDSYKNKYLFALADLDNYKKRVAAEKPGLIENGEKKVLNEIISICDDFERAISTNKGVEEPEMLKEGFIMLYEKFMNILESFKVKKFKSTGEKFDVTLHEAVTAVPVTEETEDNVNTVLDTTRSGYTYKDSVLRHAQVVVYTAKKED